MSLPVARWPSCAARSTCRGPGSRTAAWSSSPGAGRRTSPTLPGPTRLPHGPAAARRGLHRACSPGTPRSGRCPSATASSPWTSAGTGAASSPRSSRSCDCADDVAALIDVLGIDTAIVAGFSMGSIVAQRVWRQHPDRVAGLVLCATTDRFRMTMSRAALPPGHGARDARRPRDLPLPDRGAGAPGRPSAPSTWRRPTSTTGRWRSSAAPARGRSDRRSPRSAGTTRGRGSRASTCPPPW